VPGNYEADFYFDGVLDSSKNNGKPSQKSSGSAHLVVGGLYGTTTALFDGCMHDVAIYNRALTSWEIGFNFLSSEFVTNVTNPDLLYYKMTEGGQTNIPLTLSNSAITGVAAKGTLWDTNEGGVWWTNGPGGIANTAIHFHGESTYITTSNSTLFNFTNNPFTINVWLRPSNGGSYYMGNDNYTNNGWYLSGNDPESSKIRFGGETYTNDHAIITQYGPQNWPSGPANWACAWNMVTITYDGTNTPLIYVNSALQATTNTFTSPSSSTNCLIFGLGAGPFGSNSSSGTNDLDGDISRPQIWRTNLAPADVANLYYNQVHGSPWP
jgi:hypothetical protein